MFKGEWTSSTENIARIPPRPLAGTVFGAQVRFSELVSFNPFSFFLVLSVLSFQDYFKYTSKSLELRSRR